MYRTYLLTYIPICTLTCMPQWSGRIAGWVAGQVDWQTGRGSWAGWMHCTALQLQSNSTTCVLLRLHSAVRARYEAGTVLLLRLEENRQRKGKVQTAQGQRAKGKCHQPSTIQKMRTAEPSVERGKKPENIPCLSSSRRRERAGQGLR